MLGQQVVNGAAQNNARQESATKRKPPGNVGYGRNTQAAGWANGQLPVAMQQQMANQNATSNGAYGRGAPQRQVSQGNRRAAAGQPFGAPSGGYQPVSQPKIATVNVRNRF